MYEEVIRMHFCDIQSGTTTFRELMRLLRGVEKYPNKSV